MLPFTAQAGLTYRWRDPNVPLPDEEAFEAIKAGVDALPAGTKMLINSGKSYLVDVPSLLRSNTNMSGEFYGPNLSTANLELLARFFTKHPDYADKTFLSVKVLAALGCKEKAVADCLWRSRVGTNCRASYWMARGHTLLRLIENPLTLSCSAENLRRSVDNINAALRGTKRMGLFEPARIDPNVPVEDMMKTLVGFVKEGKFDHIGLSECSAQTLRRAHAVSSIIVMIDSKYDRIPCH